LEKYHIVFDHFVNADETILRGKKDNCRVTRLESQYKKGGSENFDSTSSIGSMTPFISALGTVWLVVFCLKLPKTQSRTPRTIHLFVPSEKREQQSQNSPLGFLLLGSASGLLDGNLWNIAMKCFIDIVRTKSTAPTKEIFLLTDNLEIHRQPSSILEALQNNCFQLYFPPNTSHFTQPLDNILFGNLKRSISKLTASTFDDESIWNQQHTQMKELVMQAIVESFPTAVFSKRNIQKAWGNVGMYPWNPDL
jgi:hypothetical protein